MSVDTNNLGRLTTKGDTAFANMTKINGELFVMTYGAIVIQLIKDLGDIEKVNTRLESMGYNIGTRLIDEFLSKSQIRRCKSFHETALYIAKVGFKMFLGVEANVIEADTTTTGGANAEPDDTNNDTANVIDNGHNLKDSSTKMILELKDNPLNDFVELPDNFIKSKLKYANILCGVIRGALEMIQLKVKCEYTKSILTGDNTDQITIQLIEIMEDVFDDDDD